MSDAGTAQTTPKILEPAPTERGWGKLLLALILFLAAPWHPELQAIVPVQLTIMLFVPAVAACALVGWWAGGRAMLAVAWVALAVWLLAQAPVPPSTFASLVRGWSLLLAGSFGLVCLFGNHPPLFTRALAALGITLFLATAMSLFGPMTPAKAAHTVSEEFARRNAITIGWLQTLTHTAEWDQFAKTMPQLAEVPTELPKEISTLAEFGSTVFPALLALQSLAAIALAWGTYHRLGRTRLGAPLAPLKDFRFNDQFIWGLIVGLVIVLLPTLTAVSSIGKNLLVFFGALYALRGLGVLSWFTAPGRLSVTIAVGGVMLLAPFLNAIALLGFLMLAVASLALGLGDTWADWRRRARPAQ